MKKINFSDKYGLTEAVLSGRKTQTRRICKYDRPNSSYDIVFPIFEDKDYDDENNCISPLDGAFGWGAEDGKFTGWNIPKYKIGEVVAVAQKYSDVAHGGCPVDSRYDAFRTANWGDGEDGELKSSAGWNNKLFVCADLMPHHIRITNVRVERLQDISDEDCLAEGIRAVEVSNNWGNSATHTEYRVVYQDKYSREKILIGMTPREAYAALIDRISGKGTWDSNPYVFVYEFELVK